MYQKFILPLRIIVYRQSAFNGTKSYSVYFNQKSNFQITAKYNSKLCSTESKGKAETDPLSDQSFNGFYNEIEEKAQEISKIEKKRIELEKQKPIIFEEISSGDPTILKRLKLLDFEVSVLREQNCDVPSYLTKDNYEELLKLITLKARKKFLQFLFINEMKRVNRYKQKVTNKEKRLKKWEDNLKNSAQIYDLNNNNLFLRFSNTSVRYIIYERLFNAYLHSPHIIFDCSYENYMTPRFLKNCANQIKYCYTANVTHPAPFHVKLCNFKKDSLLRKYLFKLCLTMGTDVHPWDFHEEDFLDLYDHNRLVYLTPDTTKQLKKFDPNDVYIIGAYVDKGTTVKASLAKATKYNLRMARFPIESYVTWKQGSKSLSLNAVFQVLLDLRLHQDWNIAFRNLPSRKLFQPKTEL